jgi:hypothetical protein
MRRALRKAVAAAIAGAAVAASAAFAASAAPGIETFRTPSGNILCAYLHSAADTSLRCDILSGLKPRPPKPRSCEFDYGGSVGLTATGRTQVLCVSDTATSPQAKVIAYGRTWRGGPFTCSSKVAGLRCSNRAGHGFFLSRQRWFRF